MAEPRNPSAFNLCTVYQNPFAVWGDVSQKRARVFTTYEVTWETSNQDVKNFMGPKRDFTLVQEISNWLLDLVSCNTDDPNLIAKDWYLIHVQPGRLLIFLMLCSRDNHERLRYPFKAPTDGWNSRPLPSATWIEHRPIDYFDFINQRERFLKEPAFSKTHLRII